MAAKKAKPARVVTVDLLTEYDEFKESLQVELMTLADEKVKLNCAGFDYFLWDKMVLNSGVDPLEEDSVKQMFLDEVDPTKAAKKLWKELELKKLIEDYI